MPKLIYIIAGEPSGDILASRLMLALQRRVPNVCFTGVGGETMLALGFKSLFPIVELSVMGFWEVMPRLSLILKRMKQVIADLEAQQPDILITVDSWGFVSALLKKVRKRKMKFPIVHYVAPQVWAWKKGRASKAAKLTDRLMALWPYEPPYFEKCGLRCDFVGHPVVETITETIVSPDFQAVSIAQFKERNHIPEHCTLLCALPGSRHSEVKRLIPIFKKVIEKLHTHFPNLFVVIPSVDVLAKEVEEAFTTMSVPHCIVLGQRERYLAFQACSFAVAASGTVTLELIACGTPHLIAYRFSRLTNFVVKRLVTTNYANLINILANRFVVPEFVLGNCRDDLIFKKVLHYLCHPEVAQEQVVQAKAYFETLKPFDMMPSEKAASVVLESLTYL